MKRVREYHLKGNYLYCDVMFIDDEEMFPDPHVLRLAACVRPNFNPNSKHAVFQSLSAKEMCSFPQFSFGLVVEEMQYFLSTLKQMYQL